MGNYSDPLALHKKEYGSIYSEYQERMLGLKSLPKDEAVDTDRVMKICGNIPKKQELIRIYRENSTFGAIFPVNPLIFLIIILD